MSKYLNVFNTLADYQAFSASTEYTQPNVALVKETNVLYYDYGDNKPKVDMSNYKVESLEIGEGGDTWNISAIKTINYIPSGITNLNSAFYEYTSLVSISEIPSGVTNMKSTFVRCTSLVSVPNIPSGVTNMESTFMNCSSLTSVPAIPSGVTTMHSTFRSCDLLVNVPEIPDSVTNMNQTFAFCKSLVNSPAIPSSVTEIGETFWYCSKLKTVTFLATTPPSYSGSYGTLDSCPALESIFVPDESVDTYKTATGWSKFASKIKPLSEKPTE